MQERIVTGTNGEKFYITMDEDMLDHIARRYYGAHARNTELLLDANPHVIRYGPKLPAGVAVRLPDTPREVTPTAFRQLYD